MGKNKNKQQAKINAPETTTESQEESKMEPRENKVIEPQELMLE